MRKVILNKRFFPRRCFIEIKQIRFRIVVIWTFFVGPGFFFPGFGIDVWAQKEVASKSYRLREREKSTGRYEKYEVKPRLYMPYVQGRRSRAELITLAPTAEKVRFRKYLADAHVGLRFYARRTCTRCHPKQAGNLHAVRARITCRQCHGDEPVPGNSHYYSPMHSRRRYASVCAKCHKGSSASFATYVVHEPNPLMRSTQKAFPVLFYMFWFMAILAVGTFAAFIPHTVMWGVREFFPPSFRLNIKRYLTARKKDHGPD